MKSLPNLRKIRMKSLRGLKSLRELNLNGNALKELSTGVFERLPELRYLDIGRNVLKKIEAGSFTGKTHLIHHVHAVHLKSYAKLRWAVP